MIVTIVVAAVALALGLTAHHFLRRNDTDADDEGLSVRDLISPVQTLTVLILAFVLATAAGSYNRAEEAVHNEANAADHLAETADFLPNAAQRRRVQADVVCYTRAVRHYEWPTMADGHGSPVPSVWTADLRAAFKDIGTDQGAFGMLVGADDTRAKARQARLTESTAAVPAAIYWFMLVLLSITVISLCLCIPRRHNRPQLATLAMATALLTATLLLVHDAERPFGGAITVAPTAITDVEHQTTRDFHTDAPGTALPCDSRGHKESGSA
ncbi:MULTISPECIES: bestrophin-like domain [Streptomyces]|uniref:DUF4239 domain-containing protein n=2 Tax=Streptomyces rimosus subsp. rimosus TaxID=132474 RepID=L8F012_STRR1|nr:MULTISPECIES: DUF4239 domain-containing protein [Streptomyces]KOG70130.1 hypothetical protein ADK78_30455 [Kitasatospora aureofaciens]MYT48308.1 DUF4239 domain-containing protein [Streptomyces sp. SID5471]KEF06591.1 hypothetical protein DF17_12520 [Streptomyces rimosus]KEF16838.1 hypothetical protein DF18_32845 [Streptomyces rimosus]KOT33919.1 hypothetical protein ADK42_22965 [Streptomyces rimosus subsp. rimosus]